MRTFPVVAAVAIVAGNPSAVLGQLSGYAAVESRVFPQSPALADQRRHGASFALAPELYHPWDRDRQSIRFEPFVRLDAADGERTHWDVRALSWQRAWQDWEIKIGIDKVFWGVTESQHLVDIVNQTDLVEDLDGEEKLGQPMVNVRFIRGWGTVDVFLLPGFRERTFPGKSGRLRFALPVSDAVFESGRQRRHLGWALRWSHYIGEWDLGVSHFAGTSREPRLVVGDDVAGGAVLVPHYDLIHQTAVDAQWTHGGWLWKLEAITRSGQDDRFAAVTGGFEYTFVGLLRTAADLGVLAEYSHDTRGPRATTPFQDDLFVGGRLVLNDTHDSDVLAGILVDRKNGSSFVSVEANRRLREGWRFSVDVRVFAGADEGSPLFGLPRDDYVQIRIERHF